MMASHLTKGKLLSSRLNTYPLFQVWLLNFFYKFYKGVVWLSWAPLMTIQPSTAAFREEKSPLGIYPEGFELS